MVVQYLPEIGIDVGEAPQLDEYNSNWALVQLIIDSRHCCELTVFVF